MEQIVDITADNRHLSKDRGFLRVTENQAEVGRVPLDQIAAVIVHAHGVTYSNALVVALAEQGASLVICGPDHAPRAILWPLQGHFEQGARMRAQWTAKQPLLKQMWKQIVVAKILMQAAALSAYGAPDTPVRRLAQDVRSRDPKKVEAQAPQRYRSLYI
ncbi:MAG: CRISPR-associated endonuclease Cas1, partial [Maricaulaceae bacterium]